jgi:hypothetical protein
MMLVGEDELEEARVGVGLVSRQRVPDLESNLLMNLLDKTLNEGPKRRPEGGEWEPIKILHGIWPISQNQSKSTAYDETPSVLRETMIRTRESQNPEPKTRTQPKLAGKIN